MRTRTSVYVTMAPGSESAIASPMLIRDVAAPKGGRFILPDDAAMPLPLARARRRRAMLGATFTRNARAV